VNNKKRKTNADFIGQKSLREIVTHLATDVISIRAISSKLVHDDYEEKRNKMFADIKEK
jgi:hypothetical protein